MLSGLNQKRKMQFTKQNDPKHVEGQQQMEFFTEGNVFVDSYLCLKKLFWISWWICFLQTCSFSLYKTLTDGVDYWDVFISCLDSFWRHPFTAEDSLMIKRWNYAKFLNLFSWRNKRIHILDGQKLSNLSLSFNFWMNFSFKTIIFVFSCILLSVFIPFPGRNL